MMTNSEFDQAMDRVFIVNDIDRRGVMATYRSPTREAARKKHFGIVGMVQREGVV